MAMDFFGPLGDVVDATDADQLQRNLLEIDRAFPEGAGERTTESVERSAILRYLGALLSADRLSFPLRIEKQEGPDFKVRMGVSSVFGLEVAEVASEAHQEAMTRLEESSEGSMLMVSNRPGRRGQQISGPDERERRRLVRLWVGDEPERAWVKEVMRVIEKKTEKLRKYEALPNTDLLLADKTATRGMTAWTVDELPGRLEEAIRKFQAEHPNAPHFRRYSVVRERVLLYDVTGVAELLPVPARRSTPPLLPLSRLGVSEDELRRFSREHHIRKLAFFGSIQRQEDFGPASDVDVLVEFEPGQPVGLIRMAGIERKLSELLGRKVDLRTVPELSRYFREDVMRHSEPVYVAG